MVLLAMRRNEIKKGVNITKEAKGALNDKESESLGRHSKKKGQQLERKEYN